MEQKKNLEMKVMEIKKQYEGEIKQFSFKIEDVNKQISQLNGKPVEDEYKQEAGFAKKEKLPAPVEAKPVQNEKKVAKSEVPEKAKNEAKFSNHFEDPEEPKQDKPKKSE